MIEIQHLTKTFQTSGGTVEALKDVSLTIQDGEIYGIIGMSGAGKSTLVRCINMLERPSEGKVMIDGIDMGELTKKELCKARRDITMIFQSFNLLQQRTCLKNICFPLELAGMKRAEAKKKAEELLETVGLPDKAKAYPSQLSGGQQQRIAIARALATNPRVLLCDEATSALDPNTTHSILSLIREINQKFGITVIVITHQMSVVEEVCSRVAILDNGVVVEEGRVDDIFAHPKTAAARRLVNPGDESAAQTHPTTVLGKRVHLDFAGAELEVGTLISDLAAEKGAVIRVINASLKNRGDRFYGSALVELVSGVTAQELGSYEGITVEEVSDDV